MADNHSDFTGEGLRPTRRQFLELGAGLGLVLTLTPSGSFAEGRDELTIAIPADLGGWDHDYLAFDLVGLAVMKNCYPFMIEYGVKEQDGARVMDTGIIEPVFAESWEGRCGRQGLDPEGSKGGQVSERKRNDGKGRQVVQGPCVRGKGERGRGLSPDRPHRGESLVEVVDDYTVRFTQSQPSDLSNHIQIICLFVYDSEELKKHATADDPWAREWATKNPQSGGAYNVVDYKAGQEIVPRSEPVFPLDAPRVKRVKLQVIPAPANRRLLLEKGEIDIALGLSRRDIDDLRSTSGIEVISSPSNEFVFMPMAMGTAPFDNPLVRQAMAHVVPYDAIIANVYNGNARRSTSPVPLDMPGHSAAGYPFDFDIDKAKALLAEAGMADGFRVRDRGARGRRRPGAGRRPRLERGPPGGDRAQGDAARSGHAVPAP